MRIGLATLAVLLVALGLAVSAAAQPWFSDGFDGYTTGSLAGQGGWTGAANVVQVETSFVKSVKSIQCDYLSWGAGDVSRTVTSSGGYHYVDFDAAADTAGSALPGTNLGYIRFLSEAGNELTRFYFAYQQLKVLLYPANQQVILDGVVNRQWYHIRLGIDLSASTLDVWIDGVRKITQSPLYRSGNSIKTIVVGQWNLNSQFTTSDTYLDNLACELDQSAGAVLVLSPMIPWTCWEAYNVFYPFVLYDSAASQYKMYYTGSAAAQSNESVWDLHQTGIVTSTDCINWKRRPDNYEPVLYCTKFWEGDALNPEEQSQVFDSVWAFGVCVIKDGSDYKMWYTGWSTENEYPNGISNKVNFRIGRANSTDGLAWTKSPGSAGAGSVLGLGPPGSKQEKGVAQPCVIKEGSAYRMWYEGYDGTTWRIFYATSPDGSIWTRQGLAVHVGATGSLDELGARNPVVITRNGQYELWYQGQSSSSPYYHVLRATSADGIAWAKTPGQVLLHPFPPISQGGEPTWSASDPTAKVHVDSIIVNPDNTCRVFFARQMTGQSAMLYGSVEQRRYHIFTEVVNP